MSRSLLIVPSIDDVKNQADFDETAADRIMKKVSDAFFYGGILIRIGDEKGPLLTKTNVAAYASQLYEVARKATLNTN